MAPSGEGATAGPPQLALPKVDAPDSPRNRHASNIRSRRRGEQIRRTLATPAVSKRTARSRSEVKEQRQPPTRFGVKRHILGGRKMHQVHSAQTSYSRFRSRSVSRNFALGMWRLPGLRDAALHRRIKRQETRPDSRLVVASMLNQFAAEYQS